MVVDYIDTHRDRLVAGKKPGVEPICEVLRDTGVQIAPSTYYATKTRPPSARTVRDAELVEDIKTVHKANKALIVLGVLVGYQHIENYLVAPRITRTTLEIHPAVAFGSVIAGAALFGVTGALLAIPVVATVQSVIIVYGHRYELVEEFGAVPGESDRHRVETAMRAVDSRFSGKGAVPQAPTPPAGP